MLVAFLFFLRKGEKKLGVGDTSTPLLRSGYT